MSVQELVPKSDFRASDAQSGRARQYKSLVLVAGLLYWTDLSAMRTGIAQRAPVRGAKPRAKASFEHG